MTGREQIAASGEKRIVTGTKMGAHILPGPVRFDEPGGLERARAAATQVMHVESLRIGLVLDESTIVFEEQIASLFDENESILRYTAYAYPLGAIPA